MNDQNQYTPYPPQTPVNPAYPQQQPYVAPAQPGVYPQQQPPVQTPPAREPKIPDRKSIATKFIELTYLILIIVESVLALRFLFKLLGAANSSEFIQFLYRITYPFIYPFIGLFGDVAVLEYELEFVTLVAMGLYALFAYIVVRIIELFR